MGTMVRCEKCSYEPFAEEKPCPSCSASADSADEITLPPKSQENVLIGADIFSQPDNQYPLGYAYSGRYKIERFLGAGGMGSVYKVYDTVENRPLALKILHSAMAGEEDGAERFKREFEILSKISNPSILRVYAWGKNDSELYFVSEFVDGTDLKSTIRGRGPWPASEAAELIAAVSDALSVAHAKGIVHRDVKPNNIMIASDRSVRLLDFGVARSVGPGVETITKTGMIFGTPEYMAPEQFNSHRVDHRSDIYSLGVVLFEMVTGQIPFNGQTPVAIAMKHIMEPPPAAGTIRQGIPPWMERVIAKCLQKDFNERYINATELAADLRKSHVAKKARMKWLPKGDAIVEDETSNWALVISSIREKPYWSMGMGLRYLDALYRLQEIAAPHERMNRWTYSFSYWPTAEAVRKMIDYQQYLTEEKSSDSKESLGSRFKKILFGEK